MFMYSVFLYWTIDALFLYIITIKAKLVNIVVQSHNTCNVGRWIFFNITKTALTV